MGTGFFLCVPSKSLFPQSWVRVMVERSDKMWSTGEGNGKPLQYSCLENPKNSMKRQKDMTPEDESSGSKDVRYATGKSRGQLLKAPESLKPLSQVEMTLSGGCAW